jgi:S1-C subfamily serine protease
MKMSWVAGCLVGLWFAVSSIAFAKTAGEWYAEGFKLSLEGKDEQAISAYRKALRQKRDWAEVHHGLAVLYFRLKDGPKTIFHLRRARQFYKENPGPRSRHNLAIVQRNLDLAHTFFDLKSIEFEEMESLSPRADKERWESAGNGFLIGDQGYLLTLLHGVSDAKQIRVRFLGGPTVAAKLVRPFIIYDLAVLQLEETDGSSVKGLQFGDSAGLQIGDKVYAPGYAQATGALHPKMLKGVITHLEAVMKDERILQMDLTEASRQSGGPLFNDKGEVVGIILSKSHTMENFQADGRIPENEIALKSSYLGRLLLNIPEIQLERAKAGSGANEGSKGNRKSLVVVEISK